MAALEKLLLNFFQQIDRNCHRQATGFKIHPLLRPRIACELVYSLRTTYQSSNSATYCSRLLELISFLCSRRSSEQVNGSQEPKGDESSDHCCVISHPNVCLWLYPASTDSRLSIDSNFQTFNPETYFSTSCPGIPRLLVGKLHLFHRLLKVTVQQTGNSWSNKVRPALHYPFDPSIGQIQNSNAHTYDRMNRLCLCWTIRAGC